jgi:hypothetical protein
MKSFAADNFSETFCQIQKQHKNLPEYSEH